MIDNVGQLAGGSKLYTYRNLNRTEHKPVYQDAAGTLPYTQPVLFDANGTEGPFYWAFDDANADETYYLVALDSDDTLLWTIEGYSPSSGSGGGNVTTYFNLNNLIANNVFLENVASISAPTNSTNTYLAPSNQRGFVEISTATGGAVGPDIRFVKNNTTANDSITFTAFAAADNPLGSDITPQQYVRYASDGVAGETYKYFQFPIVKDVKNIESQEVTFTCWMRSNIGTPQVTVYSRQYFGSGGGASADERHTFGAQTLTADWAQYVWNATIPSIVGKTLGACGDDALYIQLQMPLGTTCSIDFIKPSLYIGDVSPQTAFETYDEIEQIISLPRPGEVRITNSSLIVPGYLPCNNGTIGSSSSMSTLRANSDVFPLYSVVWNAMSGNEIYAQMLDSSSVPVSYGASAEADFAANRQLALTRMVGQTLAGRASYLPSITDTFTVDTGTSTNNLVVTNAANFTVATPVRLTTTGTLPANLVTGQTYYTRIVDGTHIRLFNVISDAITNTDPVTFADNGTGTQTITVYMEADGIVIGNDSETLVAANLPTSFGTVNGTVTANTPRTCRNDTTPACSLVSSGPGSVTNAGGGQSFSLFQPTTFVNYWLKK